MAIDLTFNGEGGRSKNLKQRDVDSAILRQC